MSRERRANFVGLDGASPQRNHLRSGPLQQLQHELPLALPERRLALALEDACNGLAETLLEERIRVGEPCVEVPREATPGRRLAGAHEANENHLAYLRHPIRFP